MTLSPASGRPQQVAPDMGKTLLLYLSLMSLSTKLCPRMLVTPDKVRLLKFGLRGVRGVPLIFILQNQKVRLKIK
jgi:hypothetical protein